MESNIIQLIDFIQNLGFTGLLIILAIPKLRKKIFNGNGTTNIKADIIKEIETNHFHSVNEKLDGLNDTLKDIRDNTRDTLNILKK